jgi:hypothetical protein
MSAPEPSEIRQCFQEYRDAWQDIRAEAAADMRALSPAGPWADDDRDERKDAGRPCIHLDLLNQFIAQTSANVRKSKRAVDVTPLGNGANDQNAQQRSGLIMAIEERSQAQGPYMNAFQCQIERSYGFAVIRAEYSTPGSFDQELLIKPVLNPDTVLLSPNYKQPDASDIDDAFFLDLIPKAKFKNDWPRARVTDFSEEYADTPNASDWIRDKFVQVAEFWKREYKPRKLFLVQIRGDKAPLAVYEDEWKEMKARGVEGEIKRERDDPKINVLQYMTNGFEILDKIDWAGSRIPIISCLGPERWTTVGGKAKRELLSMVRFARDPQLLFDYFASGEAEEAGQIPKSPFVGAKGQFESDKETWDELTKVPHAYVQYDAVTDATGQNTLPPPTRGTWTPNFSEWEVAKDSATRSVQAAMGLSPAPTAAARRNEKSGVALERIDDMEALGTFPFVDNYENRFLHNMGWQLNELITPVLDTQREMPMAKPDGSRTVAMIVGNTSHPIAEDGTYELKTWDGKPLPEDHIHTGKGDFGVTISSGPSHDSEREEQGEFVDSLIQELANLPQPGTPAAKVFALGIRMRPTLGPIGKQIADVFDPPDPSNLPPEAQAIVSQLRSQLMQAQQQLQAYQMEHAGRVLEQQTKVTVQQMKEDAENFRAQLANDIKVLIAEIGAKAQDAEQRNQMYAEFWKENHSAAHDVALQKDQQEHDASQAQLAARNAASQQAQQLAAQQAQPQAGQ